MQADASDLKPLQINAVPRRKRDSSEDRENRVGSADFQICCVADFQVGTARLLWRTENIPNTQIWKPATQPAWKPALHAWLIHFSLALPFRECSIAVVTSGFSFG
jgi:hypothetical protein